MEKINRIILLVLDSVGIGAAPDAAAYGDEGANTLGHIADELGLPLSNLARLGLGKLGHFKHLPLISDAELKGVYGKAQEASQGKDTITGHWEMAGNILEKGFPTVLGDLVS